MSKSPEALKAEILKLTREYSRLVHANNRPGDDPLHPGNGQKNDSGNLSVPYAGRVFDEDEVEAAVSSTLDFWLTLGKEGDALQEELAKFLGIKKSILTNSGSSANLLAVSSLTSHKLPKEKRLRPGDEVITCAAGFPTTVSPMIQNQLVPVFLDNNPVTGNVDFSGLEEAFVPGKTKALMFAHTLGNPFDLKTAIDFCKKHDLWLIEDNCDALGCSYTMPDGTTQYTGTWGDLSTQSFYPPHHLTMGEGGAVNIRRDMKLKILVESFRDWGRDCWCASGIDNTCNKRFGWQLGELPEGYDHKYIYSHIGYNIKPLDTQAAIGRQQVKKLPKFIQARKDNWEFLRKGLAGMDEFFEFCLPTHATGWSPDGFTWDGSGCRVDCSWFGFMLLVRPEAPFTKSAFAKHLDQKKIGNRMLFGGNLVRQPAFVQLKKDYPEAFRVVGDLVGADRIMNEAIFIGVYPGLTKGQMEYMIDGIQEFVRR
ncbi:lipopolysaccharide biosynthesis protein RfbH [Puniceicoccales bacterium CK1056]|uniref:Lipopolysaccharide biosynthesis protein RfbH n=1 Tax=Oceanipulchritudo coccoides TaxID=2706888 RepID=A0A6B2M283_9BACT|nr:lipopolysaccharide biosynthesis protein RfbH [Oceanipulchritudo coccoides]NDV63048.1 lipopolysaccharide biosynthesis protein RfbH [Oceanipulchritudo coccoides]